MKIKKCKILVSLLLLVLPMQFHVYGQLTEGRYQNKIEPPDNEHRVSEEESGVAGEGRGIPFPRVQSVIMYGRLMKLMSLILSPSKSDSSDQRPAPIIKNSTRFSGKNPFMPLAVEQTTRNTVDDVPDARRTVQAKAEPCPVIRLTATFTAAGLRKKKPTVIIEENGVSRFASIGDKIAGMTIIEIRRGEVILNRGDRKCVMTLGPLSEETAANGS